MDEENRDVQVAPGLGGDNKPAAPADTGHNRRARLWVNWLLVLLTAPAAAVVMIYALGAVMSTAACSTRQCPNLGPNGISFNVLFYGAPVVAVVAIVISFFTARRRSGIIIPICALALLIADIAVVAVTVAQ